MSSRIFTVQWFDRFARKSKINDDRLVKAVDRADSGLIYADLGEGVIKQAVARPNESASKGFRTIIGFKTNDRAFFLFGFAKSESDNITAKALNEFRALTERLMALSDTDVGVYLFEGELRETRRSTVAEGEA